MIFLKQKTINNVAVTLNEKNSLTGNTFNINFQHIDTNKNVNFDSTDISTCPNRYNQFEITVTGSTYVNLSASTISLENGFHNYEIKNISGDTLETGLAYVTGTTSAIPTYQVSPTKIKKVYVR